MEFIQHSIAWCKGEIFEGKLVLLFGLLVIIIAVLFFKFGGTPNAKAMLYPLLITGLLYSLIAGGMIINNQKRIVEYQLAYEKDPDVFVLSEKERADNFISWYPKTRWIFAIIGLVGIALNIFWATPLPRAIGISLIILMLSTYVIDHFSEERADTYYKHITEALE